MSTPVAILISGRGSNMLALIKACENPDFPARIVQVIANRPHAQGLQLARDHGIDTRLVDHTLFDSRAAFEQALDEALRQTGAKIVCLAGFMRLLGPELVSAWQGRMINIHPSLLPAFKGLDTHERALAAGASQHGCTVHFVSAGMDEGAVIGQSAVPVMPDDTPQTLANRVLAAEHRLYPACLRALVQGDINLEDGRVMGHIHPNAVATPSGNA